MSARRVVAALTLSLCISLPSCSERPTRPEARVVARAAARAITSAELVVAERRGIDESRSVRLDRLIGTALLAQAARERGIADEVEVRVQLELLRARAVSEADALLAQALFERERVGAAPSEAELLAHYERTKGRHLVRMMRLRRVQLSSREEAEAANARLGASGRLDAANAELIGPTEIQRLPRELLPEVLSLRVPGERVVAGNALEGFSLVELVEYLPASPRPFEQVREQVAREVATVGAFGAIEARAKALREKAEIEIDEAALADDATLERLEQAAAAMGSRVEPTRCLLASSGP